MYVSLTGTPDGWIDETSQAMAAFGAEHRKELDESERAARFPADLYREMGRRGWIGPITPVTHGGAGGGAAEYCVISEEVGRHRLISPQISIQGERWLLDWGTPEQVERYLPGIATGQLVFSESISEPGVGSSFKGMSATATRDGDDWILSGHKTHVNLGADSDVTLIYAMAEEGLTSFLVDTDTPGVSTRRTDPIGLRLIPTADVLFDSVRVPAGAILGEPGGGLDTFLSTFNLSRLGNASELIGLGRRALGLSVQYARDRQVGDAVVTDFQGIQWTIADCYDLLYAASLARDHAVAKVAAGEDHALEVTLAKKLAVSASERAGNECFALTGGHGMYYDTDYGAVLHDIKVLRVAGGSLEILRNYIARRVLKSADLEGLL